MIIDSHMHFGKVIGFDLSEEIVIKSMYRYNIDMGIVSCILGAEFDAEHNVIPPHLNETQKNVIEKTASFVREYPDRLKGMFWIKPHTQGFSDEIGELLLKNREYICALKAHPFYSNLAVDDPAYEPYYDFAREACIPIAIHSSCDNLSNPGQIYEAARKHPKVNFINVHMGLLTDNEAAIEYCSRLDNLFNDTSWVPFENVLKAVQKCGSTKILFGTDAPIDGIKTYDYYKKHMKCLTDYMSQDEADNVLFRNSKQLFKL